MTLDVFDAIRAKIREIADPREREFRSISYEWAVHNQRDRLPVFVWPPKATQADREAFMAMIAREDNPLKPAIKWGRGDGMGIATSQSPPLVSHVFVSAKQLEAML